MAESSISVVQLSVDHFSCPVCLNLLEDPVATPCGHSFCKVCINDSWDQEDWKCVYNCPLCRHTFSPRPVLHRNIMLEEVMKKLNNSEAQAAGCDTGPGDVECDLCHRRKRKAVKSCLMCLTSFCETHLKPHYDVSFWKKHKLVEVSEYLQEKVCSKHHEVLNIFCRTDQSLICYLCTINEHRGHDVVAAAAEQAEKQTQLKEHMKFQQRLQEKQKKVQELKQAVNIIKHSAQAAVDVSENIFTEMISSMEKKRLEVKELIRDQKEAKLSRAERFLEQEEQEISDLQRRITELEQLLHTHNHIQFLQSFQPLCVSSGCEDSPNITVNQHLPCERMMLLVCDLQKRFEELCQEDFIIIHEHDFCNLTLDPNTVNYKLILSENNKVVTHSATQQPYSDHPERFDTCSQVLSKESVCGRCYWEVEWSGGKNVFISVSYKDIGRKGQNNECWFGYNNQSWSLQCSSSSVFFSHNNIMTALRVSSPSRIGVYVDYSAGTLSFYSVSDMRTLLHKVQTTFTQPLYAGFILPYYGTTVRLCETFVH